ncbi:MAG TPA: hypothetical protein VNO70_17575 [Blastocatellia bacterium]|nr:hypothetical protein [Blastocatellia bacterium]
MNDTNPVYCQECGRANRAAAARCLWCGAPLLNKAAPHNFEPTLAELDYHSGIARLDDPLTVKVMVSAAGVEVTELMPGSRRILIPAASIIDVDTYETEMMPEPNQEPLSWWERALRALRKDAGKAAHDYVLKITYEEGGEIWSALFHREGDMGASLVNRIARAIGALVRRHGEKHSQGESG